MRDGERCRGMLPVALSWDSAQRNNVNLNYIWIDFIFSDVHFEQFNVDWERKVFNLNYFFYLFILSGIDYVRSLTKK